MEFNLERIKGLFLLILAVSANFVGNLLGCKTQKLLTENMFAKHIVLILLIYFTVDLTSNKIFHPGKSSSLRIGKNIIANFGELNPILLKSLGIFLYFPISYTPDIPPWRPICY